MVGTQVINVRTARTSYIFRTFQKQTNPPEPRKNPGDFDVRPTGFEPATFRVRA